MAVHQSRNLGYVANYGSGTVAVLGTDVDPPTWPAGSALSATAITLTSLSLSWSAAQDNGSVSAYLIYRDGVLVATTSAVVRSVTLTGLAPATSYAFEVEARDAVGNTSTDGPSLHVSTLTIHQAMLALIDSVNALVPQPLSEGRANGLLATLNAARHAIASGRLDAAARQLEAFAQQVQALVASGEISQAQATALLTQVNALLAALG